LSVEIINFSLETWTRDLDPETVFYSQLCKHGHYYAKYITL